MTATHDTPTTTGERPRSIVTREVIGELEHALGRERVISTPEELIAFEYDGTIERGMPQAVVFPETSEQVSAAVTVAHRFDVPEFQIQPLKPRRIQDQSPLQRDRLMGDGNRRNGRIWCRL